MEAGMKGSTRHLAALAIALIAAASATAAGAATATPATVARAMAPTAAPRTPTKVAGLTSFVRALPYGKSKILLVNARVGEVGHGVAMLDADGSLDRSFGTDGVAAVEAEEREDAAVAPDGTIVVVTTGNGKDEETTSEARVTRLLPDGQVDRSFGQEGSVGIRFGRNGSGEAVAVAPDGDILVAGTSVIGPGNVYVTDANLAIARLTPDGSPDPSFGRAGVRIIKVGDEIGAEQIAPTPSGGILVEEGNEIDSDLWRLNRDGTLDRRFGYGGIFPIEGRRGKSGARQLLLPKPGFVEQPDGKVLFAASGLVRTGGFQGLIGRIDTKGHMDRSWGRDGWVVLPNHAETSAKGMAPLSGGRLAVATTFEAGKGKADDFGAIALDRHGRPDPKFAGDGSCRATLPGAQVALGAVALGPRAFVLGHEKAGGLVLACPATR
jgi:uncharacterized delta-60 repeat protein